MEKINVIIIDLPNLERKKKHIEACQQHANVYEMDESQKIYLNDQEVDNISNFDLVLIHVRDKQYKDKFKGFRIWYGGQQGYDSDVPKGEDKINRAIISRDFITSEEAKELIEYVIEKQKNLSTLKPKILILFDPKLEALIHLYKSISLILLKLDKEKWTQTKIEAEMNNWDDRKKENLLLAEKELENVLFQNDNGENKFVIYEECLNNLKILEAQITQFSATQ